MNKRMKNLFYSSVLFSSILFCLKEQVQNTPFQKKEMVLMETFLDDVIYQYLDYYQDFDVDFYDENLHYSLSEIEAMVEQRNHNANLRISENEQLQDESYYLKLLQENSKIKALDNSGLSFFEIPGEEELAQYAMKQVFSKLVFDSSNSDLRYLENLGIVVQSVHCLYPYTFGYDSECHTLILYKESMEYVAKKSSISYLEELCHTLLHGFNFVRMSYLPNSQSLLLNQAASESELYYSLKDQQGNKYHLGNTFDYPKKLNHEALILLMALGLPEDFLDQYYEALFNSDTSMLSSCFHMEDSKERQEFYQVLRSIDAIFYSDLFFEEGESFRYSDAGKKVGMGYRVQIFKIFCRHLLEYKLSHKEMTLEEQLILFDVAKNMIVDDWYYYFSDSDREEEYIQMIAEMEQTYIKFLAKYYHCSINSLRDIEKENEAILQDCQQFYSTHQKTEALKKLFENYPVLEIICYENLISDYSYSSFLSSNQLVLKKD